MMNEAWIGIMLSLGANMVAAFSQLLLKTAAGKQYKVWWRSYVNLRVIAAYAMFVGTTIMNVIALRYIPLSLSAALGASGQIFVPAVSAAFLKEHIDRKRMLGMAIIVIGIMIYSV